MLDVGTYNRLCPNSYWDFERMECAPAIFDERDRGINVNVFRSENILFSDRMLIGFGLLVVVAGLASFLYYRSLKKGRRK